MSASVGPALRVLTLTLLSFSIITVCLRIFTKAFYTRRRLQSDDYTIICALILATVATATLTVSTLYGIGSHVGDIPPERISKAIEWINISNPFNSFSGMLGRISFALFILNLLGPGEKLQRSFLWCLIGLQVVVNVAVVIQILTQCGANIWLLWSGENTDRLCIPAKQEAAVNFLQSATSAATDLALTLIPLFVVRKLHALSPRKKVGLAALLSFSLLGLAASLARTVFVRELMHTEDFTYSLALLLLAAETEIHVVMIAGSVPSLRPLFAGRRAQRSGYVSEERSAPGASGRAGTIGSAGRSRGMSNPKAAKSGYEMDYVGTVGDASSEEIILSPRFAPSVRDVAGGLDRSGPGWERQATMPHDRV